MKKLKEVQAVSVRQGGSDMGLILASASPRRQEILKNCGYDFEVVPADIDELVPEDTASDKVPELIAVQKAMAIAQKYPKDVIVAADTVVVINDKILGKPKDKDDAFRMLKTLSGNTHCVYTGVCIAKGDFSESFVSKSFVTFYDLSDEEILDYIKTGEPMDKAGAYGIQCKGALFVKEIKGDYFNIVGLPVAELSRKLTHLLHN